MTSFAPILFEELLISRKAHSCTVGIEGALVADEPLIASLGGATKEWNYFLGFWRASLTSRTVWTLRVESRDLVSTLFPDWDSIVSSSLAGQLWRSDHFLQHPLLIEHLQSLGTSFLFRGKVFIFPNQRKGPKLKLRLHLGKLIDFGWVQYSFKTTSW